jgi:ferredoxin hydrogenase
VAQVEHQGVQLKVGIVAGIQHVAPLLDSVQKGEADFDFIEVMCCPLGCVSGGGQPKTVLPQQRIHATQARKQALYAHDKGLELRKSHENPQIQQLYKDFLGEPLGEKSHHLLHIDYRTAKNGGKNHE